MPHRVISGERSHSTLTEFLSQAEHIYNLRLQSSLTQMGTEKDAQDSAASEWKGHPCVHCSSYRQCKEGREQQRLRRGGKLEENHLLSAVCGCFVEETGSQELVE